MIKTIGLCVRHNIKPVRKVYKQISTNCFGVDWFCLECELNNDLKLYDSWDEAIKENGVSLA